MGNKRKRNMKRKAKKDAAIKSNALNGISYASGDVQNPFTPEFRMRYGKYKDVRLERLPVNYLLWMLNSIPLSITNRDMLVSEVWRKS